MSFVEETKTRKLDAEGWITAGAAAVTLAAIIGLSVYWWVYPAVADAVEFTSGLFDEIGTLWSAAEASNRGGTAFAVLSVVSAVAAAFAVKKLLHRRPRAVATPKPATRRAPEPKREDDEEVHHYPPHGMYDTWA